MHLHLPCVLLQTCTGGERETGAFANKIPGQVHHLQLSVLSEGFGQAQHCCCGQLVPADVQSYEEFSALQDQTEVVGVEVGKVGLHESQSSQVALLCKLLYHVRGQFLRPEAGGQAHLLDI